MFELRAILEVMEKIEISERLEIEAITKKELKKLGIIKTDQLEELERKLLLKY